MKKILITGLSSNVGGIETVVFRYCKQIDKCKFHIDLLSSYASLAFEKEYKELNINIIKVPLYKDSPILYNKAIKQIFKLNHYDAVWCNTTSVARLNIIKEAKKQGVPIRILHSHIEGKIVNNFAYSRHLINKLFLKRYVTDFWACSLEAGKWMFGKKVRENDIIVINNAIPVNEYSFDQNIRIQFREELGVTDKFVLMHTGRFHMQKNHAFLIDIFKEVLNIKSNAILFLVGDGELKGEIIKKINDYGIAKSVRFLGVRNDISKLLQVADTFVMPSVAEGFSVSAIEAQAAALPCFFSDVMTKDIAMINSVYFLSLNKPAKEWAKIIIEYSENIKRESKSKEIAKRGFDIEENARLIESLFTKDNRIC